jgi:pimeloyl-ACP methyl ester carboxylesterase
MRLAKKIGTGAVIAAGFAGVNALKENVTFPTPPPFYDPPTLAGTGEPGEIVRVEEIPWIMRTPGWRILYRSVDHRGKPTIVSGLLAAPAGPAPDGGWPVVAVAHGTAGLPRGAAPSMTIDANSDATAYVYAKNLAPFLDAGYAVAYTDYQGLGAPGEYSYLVGATEAANVLDAVRAIHRFSGIPVSDRLLVWGHSQGGHAAAFAVEQANQYAPELTVSGVVLVAPAAELRLISDHVLKLQTRSFMSMLVMISVASWAHAYPELKENDALTSVGALIMRPSAEVLRMKYGALCCRPFKPEQLFHPEVVDKWEPWFTENTPGHHPLGVPILIQQGDDDEVIPPASNLAFAARLEANGERVTLQTYPGQTHTDVLDPALPAAIAWMADLRTD